MITKTDSRGVQNGKELVCLAFKSTDNKPTTGIMNGSTGIEVNTGKKYVFDEESGEWTEIASSGGGGGGGGSSDFSTAEVEVSVNTGIFFIENAVGIFDDEMNIVEVFEPGTYSLVLYKGLFSGAMASGQGYTISSASGTGGVTVTVNQFGVRQVEITGDGTLTVELTTT